MARSGRAPLASLNEAAPVGAQIRLRLSLDGKPVVAIVAEEASVQGARFPRTESLWAGLDGAIEMVYHSGTDGRRQGRPDGDNAG